MLSEHISPGFSRSKISYFRSIENKHDVYREKRLHENILEFLREHAIKTINFNQKKTKLLTTEEESYEMQKYDILVKKYLKIYM